MKGTLMELVRKCQKAEVVYGKEMENLERAATLEKLGFKKMAEELFDRVELAVRLSEVAKLGYVRITEEKIKDYLKAKVERYNKQHAQKTQPKHPEGWVNAIALGVGNDTDYARMVLGNWDTNGSDISFMPMPAMPNATIQTTPQQQTQTFEEHTCDWSSTKKGTIGKFVWTETPLKEYGAIPPKRVLKALEKHKKRNIFDFFTIARVNSVVDPLLLGRVEGCGDRFFVYQWGSDIQLDDVI